MLNHYAIADQDEKLAGGVKVICLLIRALFIPVSRAHADHFEIFFSTVDNGGRDHSTRAAIDHNVGDTPKVFIDQFRVSVFFNHFTG